MSGRKERAADLEALKKRLAEKEAATRKQAGAPPAKGAAGRASGKRPGPPSAPPPSPPKDEPPISFDDEMSRMGVGRAPSGPERLVVRPDASGPRRPPALPGEDVVLPENVDDETLWAMSTRGVSAKARGVARPPAGRSEALPTLDLHGFTEVDAKHELRRFVALHQGPEARWVRVITGRGTHGLGVLRQATLAWLKGNSLIASFGPAPQHEGGTGVLLVQLKRAAR